MFGISLGALWVVGEREICVVGCFRAVWGGDGWVFSVVLLAWGKSGRGLAWLFRVLSSLKTDWTIAGAIVR